MITPVQSQRYAAQVRDFTEAEHRDYYQFLVAGGRAEEFFQNVQKHMSGRHDQSTHGNGDGTATHVFSEYGDKFPLVRVSAPTKIDSTSQEYEMQHEAPSNNGFSVNILKLDEHMPDVLTPSKGPKLYGSGSVSDTESFKALYSLTGDPNQKITIYRGVPTAAKSINNGDWVTLSPSYAAQHVASNLGGNGHVLATEVPASALWSDGDSINEFGLDFSSEVRKHMAGMHDQSTHAPQSRKGVPAGIDLEGKRYSEEAVTELRDKVWAYQDALNEAHRQTWKELGISEANPNFSYQRHAWTEAITGRDKSPEALAMKAKIDESMASNTKYQDAKKALEANFLYKDAMDVHDSNGVRLGDKIEKIDSFDETPSDYLMRMGVGGERLPNPSIFESGPNYYDNEMTSKIAGVRVSPEEAVDIATTDFKLWAAKADSVIVMPQDKLNKVLASGRVKTVHETGTSTVGSNTQDYIDHRLVYENMAYGYDDSTPVEARPVSGILMQGGYHPDDALSVYGGKNATEIILKPETRERTTWTENDSLNTFRAGKTISSTVFSASHTANKAGTWRKATGKNYFETKNFRNHLTEIQVHGGIKTSDIAKVRFFSPPSASAVARLAKLDIPYEVVEAGVTTN